MFESRNLSTLSIVLRGIVINTVVKTQEILTPKYFYLRYNYFLNCLYKLTHKVLFFFFLMFCVELFSDEVLISSVSPLHYI